MTNMNDHDWYVEHGWPDGMVLLGELMKSCGVPNDGVSSPRELWARCISKIERSGIGKRNLNLADNEHWEAAAPTGTTEG